MDGSTPHPTGDLRNSIRFYLLDHRTRLGKVIDIALLFLNIVFIAVFVATTYPLPARVLDALWAVEVAISVTFLVEYVLRVYGAKNRFAEVTDPYTVVDLAAILPTFAILAFPISPVAADIGFLRVIRVVRFLRFYRFTRDAEFFFGTVSDNGLRAMKLLLTVLTIFFVAAGLFYSVEVTANPNVDNFGDSFYYVVVTVTTVGFGDIIPVTEAGRWVTVSAILAGIILIPWQASRIVREWTARDRVDVRCPNCGLIGHDRDASHCKACGNLIYQEYDPDSVHQPRQ